MDKASNKVEGFKEEQQLTKPQLSFSIENILRKNTPSQTAVREVKDIKTTNFKHNLCPPSSRENLLVRLPWLAYTRYSPPKIPSKL